MLHYFRRYKRKAPFRAPGTVGEKVKRGMSTRGLNIMPGKQVTRFMTDVDKKSGAFDILMANVDLRRVTHGGSMVSSKSQNSKKSPRAGSNQNTQQGNSEAMQRARLPVKPADEGPSTATNRRAQLRHSAPSGVTFLGRSVKVFVDEDDKIANGKSGVSIGVGEQKSDDNTKDEETDDFKFDGMKIKRSQTMSMGLHQQTLRPSGRFAVDENSDNSDSCNDDDMPSDGAQPL